MTPDSERTGRSLVSTYPRDRVDLSTELVLFYRYPSQRVVARVAAGATSSELRQNKIICTVIDNPREEVKEKAPNKMVFPAVSTKTGVGQTGDSGAPFGDQGTFMGIYIGKVHGEVTFSRAQFVPAATKTSLRY